MRLALNAMNGQFPAPARALGHKIACLVRERGWTHQEFASRAGLSRQTAREILENPDRRRLRNQTVFGCARALGIGVQDLRAYSTEQLLAAAQSPRLASCVSGHDLATQPVVRNWLEDHPQQAALLTPVEMADLLSRQGTGGPLTQHGLEQTLAQLERRRRLVDRVQILSETDYVDLLEKIVDGLFEKIQPYRDRR